MSNTAGADVGGSEDENATNQDRNNNDDNNNNKATTASDVMKRLSGVGGVTGSTTTTAPVFKLAPFNPSSDQIQRMALGMLSLTPDDVLFDLGCGDGRFLCHAATQVRGLRCVGIEIDSLYVSRARDRVGDSGLESFVDIRLEDATRVVAENAAAADDDDDADAAAATATTITTAADSDSAAADGVPATNDKAVTDLTLADDATAVYLFILPKGIVKMMPILESLRERRLTAGKRFRVLSYMFAIRDWEATLVDETAKGSCPVYYYDFGGAHR